MGDRGNIRVAQGPEAPDVFLYSHWGGSDLANVLQVALSRRQRWDDPAYLTRIIFDAMTEGHHGSETGYGVSTCCPDNEHAVLRVLPWGEGKVQVLARNAGERALPLPKPAEVLRSLTFDEFAHLEARDLQAFFEPEYLEGEA